MADFDEKKEREAFEAHYANCHSMSFDRMPSGMYRNEAAFFAWEGWHARAVEAACNQPSAPALPVDTIKCAIHAIEFCKVGVEYRDTLVTYDAHIDSLRALLPPTEQ